MNYDNCRWSSADATGPSNYLRIHFWNGLSYTHIMKRKKVPVKTSTPPLRENDRVLIRNGDGEERTITVRWLDSKTGILSKPDYQQYHTPEAKEFGWGPPIWTVIKKLPKKKKKK